MLRTLLLYLSSATWARRLVSGTSLGRRAASRFIAGESLPEAISVAKSLNQSGIRVTLDYLGEHTEDREKALKSTDNIVKIIASIKENNLKSGISIKLTQIGLALDKDICLTNLRRLVAYAAGQGIFVRIDMEDSPWVEHTLDLFQTVRDEFGPQAVGIVIQSYLYRSEEDVKRLLQEASRIRLCKGAYLEPPEVAFPEKNDVDANFDGLMEIMVKTSLSLDTEAVSDNGITPPVAAFATHDPARIDLIKAYVAETGLPKSKVEFQMLFGIQRELQKELVTQSYPVRVYVPFGEEWYPYFMRRLAERPANVWFFLRHYLGAG